MTAVDRCLICGGELQRKRWKSSSAVAFTVQSFTSQLGCACSAESVFMHLRQWNVLRVRQLLERDETTGFEPLGRFFEASRS